MRTSNRFAVYGALTLARLPALFALASFAYSAVAAPLQVVLVVPDTVTTYGSPTMKIFGSGLFHVREVRFDEYPSASVTPVSDVLVEAEIPDYLRDGAYTVTVSTDTDIAELPFALEINRGGAAAPGCGGIGGSGGSNGGGPIPPTLVVAVWDGLAETPVAVAGSSVHVDPGNLTGSMLAPGVFTFTVPRDQYTVVASAPGFDDCHTPADLSSGGTYTVEFAMGTCAKNAVAERVVSESVDVGPLTVAEWLSLYLWDYLLFAFPLGALTAPSLCRFILRGKGGRRQGRYFR